MRLTPPSKPIFFVSLVLFIIALLNVAGLVIIQFGAIGATEIAVIGLALLLAGVVFKGI